MRKSLVSMARSTWARFTRRIEDRPGIVIAGRSYPLIAGGAPTPEEEIRTEHPDWTDEQVAAELERLDAEPEPELDPVPPVEEPPVPGEIPEEEWDKARAARTIKRQRAAEKAARERADKAEAELADLRQKDESERERLERERDEARQAAADAADQRNGLLIDEAIRAEATVAGVTPKRLARLVALVDRKGIEVVEGEVIGAGDAVEDVLDDDDGYFVPKAEVELEPEIPEVDAPEEDEVKEPRGGNADRKHKPKPMTPEQVSKLAKENPTKFNELFEAGKIPKSALGSG